ncbi:hypothetical protein HPB48_016270 [Haemaphysalis longicornis]|uniref:Uncharacterized protein n=1 Tax=Haemaphysalis longicornis TaxID=44386 RepID=A0A9J6G9W5_HAELO|nr:hypothetical protein HPB48_016269 [Haemaphysalis longicornis]KAH9375214.1 hypothetical protein HPB48_016270 [Haemaphysalis longicornis]
MTSNATRIVGVSMHEYFQPDPDNEGNPEEIQKIKVIFNLWTRTTECAHLGKLWPPAMKQNEHPWDHIGLT